MILNSYTRYRYKKKFLNVFSSGNIIISQKI